MQKEATGRFLSQPPSCFLQSGEKGQQSEQTEGLAPGSLGPGPHPPALSMVCQDPLNLHLGGHSSQASLQPSVLGESPVAFHHGPPPLKVGLVSTASLRGCKDKGGPVWELESAPPGACRPTTGWLG